MLLFALTKFKYNNGYDTYTGYKIDNIDIFDVANYDNITPNPKDSNPGATPTIRGVGSKPKPHTNTMIIPSNNPFYNDTSNQNDIILDNPHLPSNVPRGSFGSGIGHSNLNMTSQTGGAIPTGNTNYYNNNNKKKNNATVGRQFHSFVDSVVSTFCFQDSWAVFVSLRKTTSLNFLDGIRWWSMTWVILSNLFIIQSYLNYDNFDTFEPQSGNSRKNYNYTINSIFSVFILNSDLASDSFFFLSGLLAVNTLYKMQLKYYWKRWLR